MKISWTTEDDEFLRRNYVYRGVQFCASNLQRSPGAIANRACRIGLGRMLGETLKSRIVRGYLWVVIGSYRSPVHKLVAEMKIGRAIGPDEVVHHIDGNKLNNDPRNIEVINRGDHQKTHWGPNCDARRDPKTGRFGGTK